jgi:HTH-type transcriptional regulator, quorum sensing regulator NprR
MHTGEIIRFYREKAGLTQSQLGEGICTTTHVSKIERGKTAYSDDIISLFSERLGIDIHHEITSFHQVEKQLQLWHNSIIMRRMNLVEQMKSELEKSPFLESSKYGVYYHLLRARYYILHNKDDLSSNILDSIQRGSSPLTAFETNLFYHVQGLIYIRDTTEENQQKAVKIFKKIDMDEYKNEECHYHLSIAYHCIGNKVMSYFHAGKSLSYFKKTNNYSGAIKAESLMLLQLSSEMYLEFEDLVERYQNLIQDSDSLGYLDQKGALLNNLGYEYYNREEYALAKKCFKKALDLAEKGSMPYLRRLCNYTDACIEGNLVHSKLIKKHIQHGLSESKSANSTLFIILFELFSLRMDNKSDDYFSYLENKALPYFFETKNVLLIERFGKVLYEYYVESEEFKKAVQLSNQLMR